MRSRLRWLIVLASVLALTVAGLPAQADHATRPHTRNLHAMGHSPAPATFPEPINSDIAFWGKIGLQR